jgi:hypothetical protein
MRTSWRGQDSSSPPRRLVFSPSATQVSCPRLSILDRLGDPPDITDRLSIVLNGLPPVSTPTPVPEDSLGLSGYDSNSNVGSPDLIEEPTAEPATSVPMEPKQEEPTAKPATPVSMGSPDSILEPEAEFAKVLMESYIDHRTTAAVAPEGQDEDCSSWLSDKGDEPDNPAPQDSGNQNTVDPLDRSPVTSPICEWVGHALSTTNWDSITMEGHIAEGDPAELEPTLETTPHGESMGTPTDA